MDDLMPPQAPLTCRVQSFAVPFRDAAAPGSGPDRAARRWRVATFGPAILTTLALIAGFTDWFAFDGLSWIEGTLIALIAFSVFWIALSLATVTVGIVARLRADARPARAGEALDVALLIPVYGEDPAAVMGNARAMLAELAMRDSPHRFTLFVLSDTRGETQAEVVAVRRLARVAPFPVHYRHRVENVDRKTGNIADWLERWGGRSSAMLVLDADSLMSGDAILDLADALSADPGAALIQSVPRLWGARTLFARVQQFSNAVYGAPLAAGLAAWSGGTANYWGHNAILRTRAFAECAALPKIGRQGRLILSHDFVEAGLLARAGWTVRFVPQIRDSYEEVPPTLMAYVLRDRRWCQGNLQHLRLLFARGFPTVSRFHLFQGAMAYLTSPAWFLLLCFWAVTGEDDAVLSYFQGLNPQVVWPKIAPDHAILFLGVLYTMLLMPKILGILALGQWGLRIADLGGPRRFAVSVLAELAASVAYAPILMVQQTVAVARTAVGLRETWTPQRRTETGVDWRGLVRFHLLETVMGWLLIAGMAAGLVTPWLAPIAASLALAVPLSALSGANLTAHPATRTLLATSETFAPPPIIRAALAARAEAAVRPRDAA